MALTFTDRIGNLMENCKYAEIHDEILKSENVQKIQSESLDLITKICELGLITITKNDDAVTACMDILVNISKISPSKESIIAFFEQAEYAIVCNRLCPLLLPIQTVLLRSREMKRTLHLTTFLDLMERNLQIHCSFPNKFINMNYTNTDDKPEPIVVEMNCGNGGVSSISNDDQLREKRLKTTAHLEKNSMIRNIFNTYREYINFIIPFINEYCQKIATTTTQKQTQKTQQQDNDSNDTTTATTTIIDNKLLLEDLIEEGKLYKRFLIMLLGKPLIHFDLEWEEFDVVELENDHNCCNKQENERKTKNGKNNKNGKNGKKNKKVVLEPEPEPIKKNPKCEARLLSETILRLVSKVDSDLFNYFNLIKLNIIEEMDMNSNGRMKRKNSNNDDGHLLSYILDDDNQNDEDSDSEDLDHKNKISINGLGNFFYLLYSEKNNHNLFGLPLVYMPSYLFQCCLPLINNFLSEPTHDHEIHIKGIKLAKNLLAEVSLYSPFHALSKFILDKPNYKDFFSKLIDITIYSEPTFIRRGGIETIKDYLWAFSPCGRYELLNNSFNTLNHPGMYGYMITQLKDFVLAGTKDTDNSTMRNHFSGNKLNTLLSTICKMKDGANTDLMQSFDRHVCALNFLRFLIISDGLEDKTGFYCQMPSIETNYIKPIRLALDQSIAMAKNRMETILDPVYFKDQLKKKNKKGGKHKKKSGNSSPITTTSTTSAEVKNDGLVSVTVGGKEMTMQSMQDLEEDTPIEEQIEAIKICLSSFDLLCSLLFMVEQNYELTDQKRKILCSRNDNDL